MHTPESCEYVHVYSVFECVQLMYTRERGVCVCGNFQKLVPPYCETHY